jgi:hypothetical protein
LIDGKKWVYGYSYEYEQSNNEFSTIEASIKWFVERFVEYNVYWDMTEENYWILKDGIVLDIKTMGEDEWTAGEAIDFVLLDIFGKVYVIEKTDLQGKTASEVKKFLYTFIEKILYTHLYSQRSLSKITTSKKDDFLNILQTEHPFNVWEFKSLLRNIQTWLLSHIEKEFPEETQNNIKNVVLLSALYTYYDNQSTFPEHDTTEEDILAKFEYTPKDMVTDYNDIDNIIAIMYKRKWEFANYGKETYTRCIHEYLGPIGEKIDPEIYPNFFQIIHTIQTYRENGNNK